MDAGSIPASSTNYKLLNFKGFFVCRQEQSRIHRLSVLRHFSWYCGNDSDESQKKLQDIVRGALLEGLGDHCTAIRNLLCQSFGTDRTIKNQFESTTVLKEKQAEFLKSHAGKTGLWLSVIASRLPIPNQRRGGRNLPCSRSAPCY